MVNLTDEILEKKFKVVLLCERNIYLYKFV